MVRACGEAGLGTGFPICKVCRYCRRPGRALRRPGRGGGRDRGWEEAAGARRPGSPGRRRAEQPGVRAQERGRAPPAALLSNERSALLPQIPERRLPTGVGAGRGEVQHARVRGLKTPRPRSSHGSPGLRASVLLCGRGRSYL